MSGFVEAIRKASATAISAPPMRRIAGVQKRQTTYGQEPGKKLTKAEREKAERRLQGIYTMCNATTHEDIKKENAHWTNKSKFNAVIGIVIVVNAIMIGLEVDVGRGSEIQDRLVFFFFELGFGVCFVTELVLRLNLLGWNYFRDAWNVLDYHLVVFSFADILLSLAFPDGGDMKMLNAFRMIRMVRLVRNVRLLRMFKDLWLLVCGFFQTLSTLFWVGLLTTIILYIFALFTMMFLGNSEEAVEKWPEAPIYFGKTYRGIFTAFQVITFESWTPIVRKTGDIELAWYLGFIAIIVLVTFGILNVIIAVIVERTLSISLVNEAERTKVKDEYEDQVIKMMGKQFKKFNPIGKEELNMTQFCKLINSPDFSQWLKLIGVPNEDAEELFDLLDVDRSQLITSAEFMTGIKRFKGLARGKDMVQLISYIQRAMRKAMNLHERIERVIDSVDVNLERLDDLWGMTEADILERKCSAQRMADLKVKMTSRKKILNTLHANNISWYKRFL